MLKKLIGGLGEREPKAQVLIDERQALVEAMEQATKTREPQIVEVGGQEYKVADDGAGRSVEPA